MTDKGIKLGFGFARLPLIDGDLGRIDMDALTPMVDLYMKLGGLF